MKLTIKWLIAVLLVLAAPLAAADRADWMRQARWGVMTHFLADWMAKVHHIEMNNDEWNKLIDGFDVDLMAKQLSDAGAGYYILSIGQNSGYYLSPNATYENLTGIHGKCSRRDLVHDIGIALQKHNIRLITYLPSGAPGQDKTAMAALQWQNGPYPNREFQERWEKIIREWATRWGTLVSGWWFDGCYFPNSMYRSTPPPNFNSFAAAARAGNPARAIAFNPGVVYRIISLTPDEDYTAGEIDQPDKVTIRRSSDGKVDGAQIQMLSYLGTTWGQGEPRFSADQAVAFTRKVTGQGGAVTWDVPVELNGKISAPFLEQLHAIGQALNTARK